ncbi:MAG: CRISPR system precrRNA processing endoribonuclease RAMP protein Cas6 [Oculatellaceae cyanobacterium bins.114]|nr:CRISPR system precrRNA processing endoribonuclease RAMP protein Cas6 [Oculatellaceae cyanobacterium bins.114]
MVTFQHKSSSPSLLACVSSPISFVSQSAPVPDSPSIILSFNSPTSFRRKGHHVPLPWPTNVFHSYLRRWNDFSGQEVDQEEFLDWIDESVIILRHHLQSTKVVAGKRGSVTGFIGAIEFGLSRKAQEQPDFTRLFIALGRFAPYCGTGHKTTFGLGQTVLGWFAAPETPPPPSIQDLLAQRIGELTEIFTAQRKRTGGDRATKIAETWATILARRELGDSLQVIATDLELSYETAKRYIKLARRSLKEPEGPTPSPAQPSPSEPVEAPAPAQQKSSRTTPEAKVEPEPQPEKARLKSTQKSANQRTTRRK